MIPFSLKEIGRGRMYFVVVVLSIESLSSKINVVIARSACADVVESILQQTN